MSETAPELLHIELLDAHGNPTGYARCDTGDGAFPGGLLAHNSGTATCEACIDWEERDDDPDTCPDCYGRGDDFEGGTCGRCNGTGGAA